MEDGARRVRGISGVVVQLGARLYFCFCHERLKVFQRYVSSSGSSLSVCLVWVRTEKCVRSLEGQNHLILKSLSDRICLEFFASHKFIYHA